MRSKHTRADILTSPSEPDGSECVWRVPERSLREQPSDLRRPSPDGHIPTRDPSDPMHVKSDLESANFSCARLVQLKFSEQHRNTLLQNPTVINLVMNTRLNIERRTFFFDGKRNSGIDLEAHSSVDCLVGEWDKLRAAERSEPFRSM